MTEKKSLNIAPAPVESAPLASRVRAYQVLLENGESFVVADTRDAAGLLEATRSGVEFLVFTGDPSLDNAGSGLVRVSKLVGLTSMLVPQEDEEEEYEAPGFEDEEPEPLSPAARSKLKGLNFDKR